MIASSTACSAFAASSVAVRVIRGSMTGTRKPEGAVVSLAQPVGRLTGLFPTTSNGVNEFPRVLDSPTVSSFSFSSCLSLGVPSRVLQWDATVNTATADTTAEKAVEEEEPAGWLNDELEDIWDEAVERTTKDTEIFKELTKVYKKKAMVDKEDKYALADYTSNGFGAMNNALRSGDYEDEDQNLKGRIRAVVKALSKPKLTLYQGTVYRHVNDLPESFVQELQAGATFVDKAFMSTSTNKSFFEEGNTTFKILFKILSKTGANVKRFSRHKDEDEILFRPSTMFRIRKVWQNDDKQTLVDMEELAC